MVDARLSGNKKREKNVVTVPFLTALLLGYVFSDMVRVADCHTGVLGLNLCEPEEIPLGILHHQPVRTLDLNDRSAVGNVSDYRCTFDCRSRMIQARSHTFMGIDHEIISKVILLPSADSFKKGCCQFIIQAKVCA